MSKLRKGIGQTGNSPNLDAAALGGLVIAAVITHLDLSPEDRDFVNQELKWLFSAADNFRQVFQTVQQRLAEEETKLRRKFTQELGAEFYLLIDKKTEAELANIRPQLWQAEIERSQPIPAPIPAEAEKQPQANNKLLPHLDPSDLQNWYNAIETILIRINIHLKNLNILFDKVAQMGDAGQTDIPTQNQIRLERIELVKALHEMAQLVDHAYGILITSPDQLIDFLEQN
jgi:hypothetical protein